MNQTQIPDAGPEERRLRQRHMLAMPHWLMRGVWEMGRARLALTRIRASDIRGLNCAARSLALANESSVTHSEVLARIAFILALLGRKLPWRSDCLVQALAGQRWLASLGIAGVIRIGAQTPGPGAFAAHAWLVVGEKIITGGNVDDYSVLIGTPDDWSEQTIAS